MHSPPVSIKPRKLRFASPQATTIEVEQENKESPHTEIELPNASVSPPYRKVRALRLFDSPATPKTILEKSSGKCANHLSAAIAAIAANIQTAERPLALPLHNRVLENVMQNHTANVNPFTPDSLRAHNKKRCRTQQFRTENNGKNSEETFLTSESDDLVRMGEQEMEFNQAPKRLALRDTNISRYQKEFIEISLIGIGEFGLVYQCVNRLDGCIYAIKKSIKPVAGSFFEKRALNEVWAHAVLGKHDNVVRYYSAWAEDNHMLIQNEYCNGGSLFSLIQTRFLVESELKILLLHVAEGLRYIHSNDLVHMDLKSGNIFLSKVPPTQKSSLPPLTQECYESGMHGIYEELRSSEYIITYKIGDLGHVTSVKEPHVEEGDCRYLPNEVLQEDFSDLSKADIFALGITLYEAAGGGPLPKNGPDWHKLRNGEIPALSNISQEFNDLIKIMTHPDPAMRPSSTSIFNYPILNYMETKSKSQINQELSIEKQKNEVLMRKLREARNTIKDLEKKIEAKSYILNSPKLVTNQRCLRSYTRKKRTTCLSTNLDGLRDRNKNLIDSNIKY